MLFFSQSGVLCCHECLEFVLLFLCDGWLHLVVVVIEDGWEHVFNSLSLTASEGEGAGIDVLGQQLHEYLAAFAIASQDATGFPELYVVQELAAW